MISIIIPWVRLKGFDRCVNAVFKNVGATPFEIVSECDINRVGCNKMVNTLVRKSRYDIVCFLHDDSVPQLGFLDEALKIMDTFEDSWGCVGFNDMIHNEKGPCTHWMIHKNMLAYFPDGVFYSEDYIHTKVDLELKEVSKANCRYKWAKDAKIKHLNPIHVASEKRDDLHRSCYSKKNIDYDKMIYEQRERYR